MQTPMTSCDLISMWHKWNAETNDIMMTWFALYANFVTSHLACMVHAYMHGTCALDKYGASKYPIGLVCMQADSNIGELTTSHFWVLNTHKANENMPNMIPIAYLNENLMDCNESLAWSKQQPLIHPYIFWYTTKGKKVVKSSFYFIFMWISYLLNHSK